ncbi:MAG TPA: hypothetical protein ENG45_00325 [Candidatus Aenigmarchaeota archaeon]|nr:hypothetical protein [Candidatus Aenigmarchaeota archaeon]
MNWKGLIVLLVILSLVGYMFLSKKEGKSIVNLFRSKVGKFVERVKVGSKKSIPVKLELSGNTILGQRLSLSGSNIEGIVSLGLIEVNGNKISIKENKYDVVVTGFNGEVVVGNDGIVTIDGKAEQVGVGDFSFLKEEGKSISVTLQGIPFKLVITNVNQDFSFAGVDGELTVGGRLKLSLSNDALNILDFSGSLSLDENKVLLDGIGSSFSIKGEDININVS